MNIRVNHYITCYSLFEHIIVKGVFLQWLSLSALWNQEQPFVVFFVEITWNIKNVTKAGFMTSEWVVEAMSVLFVIPLFDI